MSAKPPLPDDLRAKTPADAQTAILALVRPFEQRIAALESRLSRDSSNSSGPPSTEPLHIKRQPPRPASRKRRGGQHGHERHTREVVPPERLTSAVEIRPQARSGCGHALDGHDPDPVRHQVAELPEIRPEVIEYRLHRLTCPGCGAATRAKLPADAPRGAFGPRLQAWAGLLSGAYRLSKRQVRRLFADPLGVPISTGMVAKLQRQAGEILAEPDGRDRRGRPPGLRRSMSTRPAGERPVGRPGSGSGRSPWRSPPSGSIAREGATAWKRCWARTPAAVG